MGRSILGIIGGGQLGSMLSTAAKKIDIKKRTNTSKNKNKDKKQADPNSPFAVLGKLL